MNIETHGMDPARITLTPAEHYGADYGIEQEQVLSVADAAKAYDFAKAIPQYQPTPLIAADDLATICGVGEVWIKHEGHRAPTKSFKVLGPPFALAQQLQKVLPQGKAAFADLFSGQLKSELREVVTCAATSGNHGRALAWAASQYGCRCRIFMPEATGSFREQEIKRFGAETVRVPGTYDSSVVKAQQESAEHGYLLVGDGAPSTGDVLKHIVHGYSVVGHELSEQLDADPPTHIFIPAGSGSLSAGIVAKLWMKWGPRRPRIIIVQAHAADSGYQSCLRRQRCESSGDLLTLMDGLSVRELSPYAWGILKSGAFGFMTIGDGWAMQMLRHLVERKLTMGETGLAALAALSALAEDAAARDRLGLEQNSRVILVATEGVTDPTVIEALLSRKR